MITLTPEAHRQIRDQIVRRGHAAGIKIGVKNSGCGGHSHTIEFVDQPEPLDIQLDIDDVTLYVDPYHTTYLRGTIIDYTRERFGSGFKFINPNVRGECGCGESVKF